MDFKELLIRIGLSEQESAVYLSLVQRAGQRISEISRTTGMHRPGLYKLLPSMVKKRLLIEHKEKKSVLYSAVSPEMLEQHYLKKQGLIQKGISDLKSMYETTQEKPQVTLMEGKKGVGHVFLDVVTSLPYKGMYFRYTSKKSSTIDDALYEQYKEIRDKKRLEQKIITSEHKKSIKKDTLEKFYRSVPSSFDLFDDNVMFIIYGPKVALIDYDSKTSMIIESEKIARFQEKIFMLLWKKLR